MAMAAVRAFHLAVIGLTVLHLLARATTDENLFVRSLPTNLPLPPHGCAFPLASDAPPPAARWSASCHPLSAPSPSTALPDGATPPPSLGVSAVAGHQDQDATASPRDAPSCPTKAKALVVALPLLAVPYLPLPVAALVALSSMAAPARAWSDHPSKLLTHATCAVYNYDNSTGTIDRRRADPSLNAECEHPLCHAGAHKRAALHARQHGREDDPLLIYCAVRVPERPPSMLPWLNAWLTVMPVVGDPAAAAAAAAASGDRVCYVELTHMGYKEGYYIRCPSHYLKGRHSACTAFPEEEIAAAVWEHRRLNYRDTVWPRNPSATATEKHDDEP